MGGTLGPALFALQQQMQPQPQQPQAGPAVDPQSVLSGMFTPQQAAPAQPQMPATNDPFADSTMQTMQTGREAFGQGQQQKAALAKQLEQVRQAQMNLQQPKTGYEPQFNKNVLGDVGKALLLGLSATGPGRAISNAYYAPGIRRYTEQENTLNTQAEELQKQLGTTEQGQASAAGMATRPYGAMARYEVGQMNNRTRQLHDAAWQKLQASKQQLDRDVASGKITQAQAHDKIEQQINAAHDQTLRDITSMTTDQRDRDAQIQAAEGEWKVNRENMLGGYVGSQLGINPTAPSQNPKAPPGPKAAGSRPNAKGKQASAGRGPSVGAIEDGYRFNGGDPSNPNSWSPATQTKK